MTRDEQFAAAKAHIGNNINTWEDLYAFFDGVMARVRETGHPLVVFDALFTLYAFVVTLRDLPEEGDVKVITERMLRTLVYDSDEKLGVEVEILEKGEADTRLEQLRKTAEAIRSSSVVLQEAQSSGKKVTLH